MDGFGYHHYTVLGKEERRVYTSDGLSYDVLALTSNTHREALMSQVFRLCKLPTENALAISLKIKKHHPPDSS